MKAVVVIPTYNRGALLKRALESVVDQTHKNWLCYVLDDGSTDDSYEHIAPLLVTYPKSIRYLRFEENRGGVAMNEIGMFLAMQERNAFWTRLGSDDYFMPWKLQLDASTFEQFGTGACYGPWRLMAEDGTVQELYGDPVENPRQALLDGHFTASWVNVAVHTDILKSVHSAFGNFCDPALKNMEDFHANTRIAYFTQFVWRGINTTNNSLQFYLPFESATGKVFNSPPQDTWRYDAVWRVASDGASAKAAICAEDAQRTQQAIERDRYKHSPFFVCRYCGGPVPLECTCCAKCADE